MPIQVAFGEDRKVFFLVYIDSEGKKKFSLQKIVFLELNIKWKWTLSRRKTPNHSDADGKENEEKRKAVLTGKSSHNHSNH
jgi:hypothetical protein